MSVDLAANIDNVIISYEVCGQGDIIIFIHGFPYNKSMWKKQTDFFKNSFKVLTFDIRGFGSSTFNEEKPSMSLFADDLIKLMDTLKIEKAILCGLSMGGYIALNAIYRFRNRFLGLILCDTQCTADTEETRRKRYKTIADIDAKGILVFADGFVKNAITSGSNTQQPQIAKAMKEAILNVKPEVIKQNLIGLAERGEMCTTLKMITVPCLIVCGELDSITPPEKSIQMAELIPGAQMHLIKDSGHFSNLEQPEEFNKVIYNFLQLFKKPHTEEIIDK